MAKGGNGEVYYDIYGYIGDSKKLLGKSSSYMECVSKANKARVKGNYEKVRVEEHLTKKKIQAYKEMGIPL